MRSSLEVLDKELGFELIRDAANEDADEQLEDSESGLG